MNLTLKQVSKMFNHGVVGSAADPGHAVNDARIARCFGEPAESVAAFRCLNQSGYASLLKRVVAQEQREGFWPPAPGRQLGAGITPTGYWPGDDDNDNDEVGALEHAYNALCRFLLRHEEIHLVITIIISLLLGIFMCHMLLLYVLPE